MSYFLPVIPFYLIVMELYGRVKKLFQVTLCLLNHCIGSSVMVINFLSGAAAVVNFLHNAGKQVVFVTNNSTKSRDKYAEKLSSLGFPSAKESIFGTAYTCALYLKHVAKVYILVYFVLKCLLPLKYS